MSIFDDIYNWFARRNIGEFLGLAWDPEKDKNFQRELVIRKAEDWVESMDKAEKELAQGNVELAGRLAYKTLERFPYANLPITKEFHERARRIIAQLPLDFKPPAPMRVPVLPRMSAGDAIANLKEASKLQDAGKLQEAYKLVNDVLDHKVHGARALEADLTAFEMRVKLNEKLWGSHNSKLDDNSP